MKHVKQFTRSITALLYWSLALVVIPLVLAMIGQVFGLWGKVDSVYDTSSLQPFVFWMLITRLFFGGVWVFLATALKVFGEDAAFFWFKPKLMKSRDVDKSDEIIGLAVGIVGMLVWSELMIRIVVGTAPYLH